MARRIRAVVHERAQGVAGGPAVDALVGRRVPLSRAATYEQVAGVVSFLCSGGGSYLTGVNLPVDGGWSKGP